MMTKVLAVSDSNLEVSGNAPSNSRSGCLRFFPLSFPEGRARKKNTQEAEGTLHSTNGTFIFNLGKGGGNLLIINTNLLHNPIMW